MTAIYICIGAVIFWMIASVAALVVVYYVLRLLAGINVAFAWFRMACKNRGALLNGYTPLRIALDAWLDYAFTKRVRKRNIDLHNGGGIYWQSWWKFRIVAGDPNWRSGDASLARKRMTAG